MCVRVSDHKRKDITQLSPAQSLNKAISVAGEDEEDDGNRGIYYINADYLMA